MNRFYTSILTLIFCVSIFLSSCKEENGTVIPTPQPPVKTDTLKKDAYPVGGSLQKLSDSTKTASIEQYHLFIPSDYNEFKKRYPVIIFMAGGGSKGSDIRRVIGDGSPGNYALKTPGFPFIVLSPQLSGNVSDWELDGYEKFFSEVSKKYNISKDSIYITGLSVGGVATWKFASAKPQRYAAATPIGAYGDINEVCKMKDVAVWAFHNRGDDRYSLNAAQQTIDAYNICATQPALFTIYENNGHNGWIKAYNDPKLYEWFLTRKRATL